MAKHHVVTVFMVSFVEAWWIMAEFEKLSTKPSLFFLKEEATYFKTKQE